MSRYRNRLPQIEGGSFLVYVGTETDLIFSQGVDLPGFASYPLLETDEGTDMLLAYFRALINEGKEAGAGVILESPTWVANRDKAAPLGYTPDALADLNRRAIEVMAAARERWGDVPTVLSANLGPRDDAYTPSDQMLVDEALAYHMEQLEVLAKTEVDLVSGYTLAYPAEATGMVLAARKLDLPIVVSFTVETDGNLPTGASVEDAIAEVDAATESYASYFMLNCAHPDHFDHVLEDAPWIHRLKGIVANASRCSHAELDEAEQLDAGDPLELGQQLADIQNRLPHINILGGCCGTDMRHIRQIGKALRVA